VVKNHAELPEVETVVRDLRPHLVGKTIVGASVHWQRTIATPSVREFVRDIRGYKITALTRRGKHLVFHLKHVGATLVVAPRATTRVALRNICCSSAYDRRIQHRDKNARRDKHAHVVFELSDGRTLRFRDTRKFGRMWLVDDPKRLRASWDLSRWTFRQRNFTHCSSTSAET